MSGYIDTGLDTSRTTAMQQTPDIVPTMGATTTVALGPTPPGPAPTTGFGDMVKSFFSSVGDKFTSFSQAISSIPDKISQAIDDWKVDRAKDKVDGWNNSKLTLKDSKETRRITSFGHQTCLDNMLRCRRGLGGFGMHYGIQQSIDCYKAQAQSETQQARQKDPQAPAVTWQAVAERQLRSELLKLSNTDEAGKVLDKFKDHFAIYEKAGKEPGRLELATILEGLRDEVTDVGKIEATARTEFSNEIDHELQHLNNFFRGASMASTSTASLIRNCNTTQAEGLKQAMRDVMTDRNLREAFKTLEQAGTSASLTREQMAALNELTTAFLERAFGLSTDGGAGFAQGLDSRVSDFLTDTGQEIAGKTGVDPDTRNEAIRKWYANGLALRDLPLVVSSVGEEMECTSVVNAISTHVLRIVSQVAPTSDALVRKVGEDGAREYAKFYAAVAPQFDNLMQLLGMPKVSQAPAPTPTTTTTTTTLTPPLNLPPLPDIPGSGSKDS